ncbi:histidine kinase [Leptobacterium flavescens]|uniref:Histidine kinase n=1 Tax=Leptobacterium flavescens TaxID=472055 RepID=A0A6P0ULM8_9FLAO|nr:2TM domain-containing protein [Leptobacterium flavescens]NER14134.1 histidine kinase [Leptobacterium flavescens]
MEKFNKESKYIRAKERVEEIKKFYGNLTSYIIVITFLAILNYWTNEWDYMWFLWAAFGWGIGIVFHAAKAFQWNPMFNKDWEERKIREFMDKDQDDFKSNQQRWE